MVSGKCALSLSPAIALSPCHVSRALTFALCPLSPNRTHLVPIYAQFQAPFFATLLHSSLSLVNVLIVITLDQQTQSGVRVSAGSSEPL